MAAFDSLAILLFQEWVAYYFTSVYSDQTKLLVVQQATDDVSRSAWPVASRQSLKKLMSWRTIGIRMA